MNRENLIYLLKNISDTMTQNEDLLTQADAKFGDGDLGISMKKGFDAIYHIVSVSEEIDLGKIFLQCSASMKRRLPL